MWVPSSELFPAVGHSHTGSFPREFTLLVTLRIHPQVRSGSFYALELFQFNIIILVHILIRFIKILSSIPDQQLYIFLNLVIICNYWTLRHAISGFGGLGVSALAFSIQVCGLKPGRSCRIFQGEKIPSAPSFGREVKPGSHVVDLLHVKDP
jgi:hypothetical protein